MENEAPKVITLKGSGSPDQAARERLGVPGLDLVGGGILQGSSLLVLGAPGSGKTTFGIQFLLEGMNQGQRGLYIFLGNASPLMAQNLPFYDQLLTHERQFRFQILTQAIHSKIGDALERFLSNLQGLERTRVVLEVGVPAEHMKEAELEFCSAIQRHLQQGGATTLLLNRGLPLSLEQLGPAQLLCPGADGIFLLRIAEKDKKIIRTLVIYSVLGVSHEPAVLDLELDADGIRVKNSEFTAPAVKRSKSMLVAAPIFRTSEEKKQYQNFFKKTFKPFEKSGKGIPTLHGKQMLFYDILTELHAASTQFGLLLVYDAIVPFLAHQGLIQPLDSLFPDYERRFVSASIRRCVVDEKLYAVPQHTSARLLFWRKDLLEKHGFKAPKTWMELEETALAIVEKEKKTRLKGLSFYFPPYAQFVNLIDHLWSQGQELYQNPSHWDFNKNAVVEVLKRLNRWVRNPKMSGTSVLHASYWECMNDFLEGRSIFLHHWSDALRVIEESGPELQNKIGWSVLPHGSEESPPKTMLGGPAYVIPTRTMFQGASEDALKTLFDNDVAANHDIKQGWPFPSLRELYRDPKVMAKHPFYEQADRLLSSGRFIEDLPYIKGNFLNWENAASQILGRFFSAETGNASNPEEAAESLKVRLSVFLPKPVYSDLVAKAVENIHKNLNRPLSVAQLSKELGVSRSHLIRQFKKGTRMTPLRYLNVARVDKAKELLQYTTFNVSEVSLQVGFKSIFHFSKVFRQLSGRNPSEFKQFRYQPK